MPVVPRTDVFDDVEYKGGAEDGREIEASETRDFSLGGQAYRTYLSAENAKLFDETFAPWIQYAEKVSSNRQRAPRSPSGSGGGTSQRKSRGQTLRIREWAESQNFEPPVAKRGRIPDYINEAYYSAHPEDRPAS